MRFAKYFRESNARVVVVVVVVLASINAGVSRHCEMHLLNPTGDTRALFVCFLEQA